MPSLHVGWAALLALTVIATARTRWRWLALAHPIVTLLVVVVTANHYWLDAIVALTLLAVSLLAVNLLGVHRPGAKPPPGAKPASRTVPARAAVPERVVVPARAAVQERVVVPPTGAVPVCLAALRQRHHAGPQAVPARPGTDVPAEGELVCAAKLSGGVG
jgi:hypothetical protein